MAEKDIMTGLDRDTLLEGHDADGITEFDNDMPLWWLVGFMITIVFAVCYIINYHMAQGPSSKAEYDSEVAMYNKLKEPAGAQDKVAVAALTDQASLDAGRAIFTGSTNQCYTCHRADLGGLVGPNLTDEYWLHGGDLASIMKSIESGYREKGMQPYGTGAKLNRRQVLQVASFILSMKGTNPPNPKPVDPQRDVKYDPSADTAATSSASPAAGASPATSARAKAGDKAAAKVEKAKTEVKK